MRFSRTDRSRLAAWWFTVDWVWLGAIAALVVIGVVLSLAASPVIATKKGLPTYYFVERHVVFSVVGFSIILVLSFFSPSQVRRFALVALLVSIVSLIWVVFWGAEIHGARRWLELGGYSLQPSEFVKPALVVILAWLFAESVHRRDMPAMPLAAALGVLVVGLLLLQPDVGQALLVSIVVIALYILSGQRLIGIGVLFGVLAGGAGAAYFAFDHVRVRVDSFLSSTPAKNSQLARAMDSFVQGGFFGRGPGEGTIKTRFPDAHNDFIFSVVAEEYGVIACLGLVALFGFIVLRSLIAAAREEDGANRLAIQGLSLAFGVQALINMGVNAGLLPAKGMTLPFISAGGSSILAISITLGLLAALMRRGGVPPRFAHARQSQHGLRGT